MSNSILLLATMLLTALGQTSPESEEAAQIELAVSALPEAQRNGTAVVKYENGERVVLREGTNGLICQPDDPDTPGIGIWCYPITHDAYARRWYHLAAEGHEPSKVDAMIAEEIEAGKLEWPDAAVNYNLRGPSLDNAVPTTVIFVPFATGESIGLTEKRQHHRPWLMKAGTAFAHIMIPGK